MSALIRVLQLFSLITYASAWSLVQVSPSVFRSHRLARSSELLKERIPPTTWTTTTRLHQASADADTPPAAAPTSAASSGKSIYSMPALYDLAFGYRDYEEEVEFLVAAHERAIGGGGGNAETENQQSTTKSTLSVLELAAGPARHSLTALQMDAALSVTAVDISPDMIEYANEIAATELPDHKQSSFRYVCDDMRSFQVPEPSKKDKFDTAWILLGSLQHLTTNNDVIQCFQSVHDALKPEGTLIIELPHPRETFSMVECTRNGWEIPLEDEEGEESGLLKIIWGDNDDTFDPITQVRQFTVAMEVTGPEAAAADLENVRQIVPMRLFTAQEIQALAQCAGWQVVAMHGALQPGVSVNDDDAAFRLVCVLRKI
jgi:SAM-dependent methyltransferase